MSIDAKVNAGLPEGTVVINDISQLTADSKKIFERFGWKTLEEFLNVYHNAAVYSHEPKGNGESGFKDPEVVLRDKAKTGEQGITQEILPQYFGALAIQYLEHLDKKAPVSIGGTADESWGFLPAPRNKMDQTLFKLFAERYKGLALGTANQPQYTPK